MPPGASKQNADPVDGETHSGAPFPQRSLQRWTANHCLTSSMSGPATNRPAALEAYAGRRARRGEHGDEYQRHANADELPSTVAAADAANAVIAVYPWADRDHSTANLVVLHTCGSAGPPIPGYILGTTFNSMASVVAARGAGTVLGFSSVIYFPTGATWAQRFWSDLKQGWNVPISC
jgi:hypothetical protein